MSFDRVDLTPLYGTAPSGVGRNNDKFLRLSMLLWNGIRSQFLYKSCPAAGIVTHHHANERASKRANERTKERTNERTNERKDEWTNGRTNERMDERTNERMDERMNDEWTANERRMNDGRTTTNIRRTYALARALFYITITEAWT